MLKLAPAELAANYGEILVKAEEASAYLDFEPEGDSLRTSLKDAKAAEVGQLATTASITFTQAAARASRSRWPPTTPARSSPSTSTTSPP